MQKEKVLRIIDANVNRAVEGLRVMEEVVRLGLDDKARAGQIKNLRASIRKKSKSFGATIQERLSDKDVGRQLYPKSESKRSTIADIFTANAKRVQEALRVLEEFSKLIKPEMGRFFKNCRFKVYQLEKEIICSL